jgi:hypothetical protein
MLNHNGEEWICQLLQSNTLFYDGPDVNKKSQMALFLCLRDNAADGEGPRNVKIRTISL